MNENNENEIECSNCDELIKFYSLDRGPSGDAICYHCKKPTTCPNCSLTFSFSDDGTIDPICSGCGQDILTSQDEGTDDLHPNGRDVDAEDEDSFS